MSSRLYRTLLALAMTSTLAAGCGADEPVGAGFDLDEEPADLSDFEGKADTDPCAPYPGGDRSGDDLLVLVNKVPENQLARAWKPADLVALTAAQLMPGRTGSMRAAAKDAFEELAAVALLESGLELGIRSAYRSFYTQCLTFAYKVETNGLEHAKRFSAEPGRSQHQLGTTVDITSARLGWGLEQTMGEEPEGVWLAANAHRFGFALSYPNAMEEVTGYGWEPWHYRYIGVEAATEMMEQNLILDLYLAQCDAGSDILACPRADQPIVTE